MEKRIANGASNLPVVRLGEQGQTVASDGHCRECGADIGAGYLCDECDTIDVVE